MRRRPPTRVIFRLRKGKPVKKIRAVNVESLGFDSLSEYCKSRFFAVDVSGLSDEGWHIADEKIIALLEKIRGVGVPLEEYVEKKIFYGIKTGFNKAFVIDTATRERLIGEDPRSAEVIKPFLAGRDIKRYAVFGE